MNNQISLKQKEALIAHRESTSSGQSRFRPGAGHSLTQHRRVSFVPATHLASQSGPSFRRTPFVRWRRGGQIPFSGALQQLSTFRLTVGGTNARTSRDPLSRQMGPRGAYSSLLMRRARPIYRSYPWSWLAGWLSLARPRPSPL